MEDASLQTVDVAIIGAGWYGLTAARTYLSLRPAANVLILDDDNSVGGVWSKDRVYPNLNAQVKIGFFNYTDAKMRADTRSTTGKVSGDMIHEYLEKYAEDHDLKRRIRFNSFVKSAKRCPRGWRLILKDSRDVIEASKLLVCTGVTSIPSYPTFARATCTIPVIHSKDLGVSFKQLSAFQCVVVVGAAKSAYDAVYLLLSQGKKVTWVIRREGSGPLAILPARPFGLAHAIEVASTRLMTYLSPSILNAKGSLYWVLQRSFPGRWLTGSFWSALAGAANYHAGYASGDQVSMLRPEIERQGIFWSNSGLGIVTLPDFWNQMRSENLEIVRDTISSVKEDTVLLTTSGATFQTDALVLCTGWGDHFGMFDDATKADIGLPYRKESTIVTDGTKSGPIDWAKYDSEADTTVKNKLPFLASPPKVLFAEDSTAQLRWRLYRRSVPIAPALRGDRSIAIFGQIHTVQTPLVADVQCFWTILYLLNEVKLPGPEKMAQEVAEWNAWTRMRYLSQGAKFPYSLYDFLPYIDALFEDLGLESRRKQNALMELLAPYKPADFDGFREEYLSMKALARGEAASSVQW